MTLFLSVLVVLLALALWRPGFGFRSQSPSEFSTEGPAFDIKTNLNGPMISEGIIYGPTGRVASRFVAEMTGEWDGDTGMLAEEFAYAGNGTQSRKWFLTMGAGGRFTATADDIIGTAKGVQSGPTVCMRYRIRLTEDAGGHVLDVVDWMYLMENGSIMNRSEMRKFGIKVAELVASIRPVQDEAMDAIPEPQARLRSV